MIFFSILCLTEACTRTSPDERLKKANDLIVSRNYDAAIREYNLLLKELTGDDADTLRLKRKTLYRLGRLHYLFLNLPDQALEYYKQVVAINPKAPLSYNALAGMGKIYQDTMQNYPQAVLAYQT